MQNFPGVFEGKQVAIQIDAHWEMQQHLSFMLQQPGGCTYDPKIIPVILNSIRKVSESSLDCDYLVAIAPILVCMVQSRKVAGYTKELVSF